MTKPRKQRFHSLRIKFVLMLVIALTAAVLMWWLSEQLGETAVSEIYMSIESQEKRASVLLDDFEEYVRSVNLSVRQAKEIARWAKHQNRVNLEISDEYEIVVDSGWWDSNDYYSVFEFEEGQGEDVLRESEDEGDGELSIAEEIVGRDGDIYIDSPEEFVVAELTEPPAIEEDAFTRKIRFSDGAYYVTVYDYSEDSLYNTVTVTSYVVGIVTFLILMLLYHQRVIKHMIKLSHEVETIAHGNLEEPITVKRRDEIGVLAEHVDVMRTSIMKQMRAEQEAWNANSDLITRMSHDIRTPLTVLLGFLELLDEGGYSEDENYQSYLNICKENTYQLKDLADKLFQYFLVFGHKMYQLEPEVVDARMLLSQLIGEHELLMQEQGWQIENEPLKQSALMQVDLVYMKRLFNNLFSNIEKYADRSQPVAIRQSRETEQIHVVLKNRIRPNPNPVESTNIGLKTCERIVQLMGGSFRAERQDDVFLAELWLPVYREEQKV